jgi:hypothetical protein
MLWNAPLRARLDAPALGLKGRELQIATIIAEETEAQREEERRALPPASPEELSALVPTASLLEPAQTEQERRQGQIDSMTWDALLIRGLAHARCAKRSGMELTAVIDFAIDRCNPNNWEVLFWYRQWLDQLQRSVPHEMAEAIADAARQEARRASGKGGRNTRWAPYRDAKSHTQREWEIQKTRYGGKKALFARAMIATLKQNYPIDDVTERTITEDWLKGR